MKRYSAIRSCNVSNRLIAAAKTGMSATYAYDPAGRRMSKTVTGGSYAGTMFFLDAGDDEIAEYDGSGNLLRRYVPGRGVDRPIAMVTAAGAKSFFHQDKTGSVIAMSDTSGNIATNNGVADGPYTYDAYGNCLIGGAACSGGVPFKYTGRRYDPETGLYFNRARFYSAAIGRFLQTDPVGYGPDLDWYAYVGNDPTDKIDPSGLLTCDLSMGCYTVCFDSYDQTCRAKRDKNEGRLSLGYRTVSGAPGTNAWKIKWSLSAPAPKSGFIIQHIHISEQETNAKGITSLITHDFWESWHVPEGWQRPAGDDTDCFCLVDKIDGYSATTTVTASAGFYEMDALPEDFHSNNDQGADVDKGFIYGG